MSLLLLFKAGSGPPSATSEPFTQVLLEMLPGAWVDISEDIRTGSTRRGRSQELDRYAAGTATVTLSNADRVYDPTYAAGPYYGNLKPMRQLKVRAAFDTVTSLDLPASNGSYASTPDSAALSITGDLDVRIRLAMDDWTPAADQTLISKYDSTGNQRSWRLYCQTSGTIVLAWSPDGTSAALLTAGTWVTGYADASVHWIRCTIRVADRVVTMYSSDDGVAWTQQFASTPGAVTSIFDGTAPVEIGSSSVGTNPLGGNVYSAEIRSGISAAATVVASPDFDARNGQYRTSTTLVDWQGNTWTRQGSAAFAAVTTNYDLFTGYIDRWSDAGNGPHDAVATVAATDGFKVLNRAQLPSSVYAAEVAASTPVTWYRLGDAAGSTTLSDSAGDFDITVTGSPSLDAAGLTVRDADTAIEFLAVTDGAQAYGDLPILTAPCSIEAIVKTTSTGPALIAANITAALGTGVDMGIDSAGKLQFEAASTAGSALNVLSTSAINDNNPHHVVGVWGADGSLKVYVDGADVSASAVTVAVGTFDLPRGTVSIGRTTLPTGSINGFVGTLDEVALYNVALTPAQILKHYQGRATAWSGDLPGARIARILDLVGWPSDLREIDTGTSVLQGADLSMSALEHIQKVAESEFGLVYMTAAGKVKFEGRASVVNQPSLGTFGTTGSEIRYRDIEPDYSDTLIRNMVTVSRLDGVAQTVTDQDSIDEYEIASYTLDGLYHNSDVVSRAIAEFIVSQYAQPIRRITSLLAGPAMVGRESELYPQLLGRELTDRVTVIERPQNVGSAITQVSVIEAITHQFAAKTWETNWALSPAYTAAYGIWDDSDSLWDQALWYF